MPRKVSIAVGAKSVVLPNGLVYDGPVDEEADPVEVTLTDAEFDRLGKGVFTGGTPLLTDEGSVPISTSEVA